MCRRGIWIKFLSILVVLFACEWGSVCARAQDRVALVGSVSDPQGLALAGATVNVFALPGERPAGSTMSDEQGTFRVEGLAPGRYRVAVRLLGFETYEEATDLSPSSQPLQITLRVGAFQQQVRVTAQMPEVSLDTVVVPGEEIEQSAAQDLAGYLRREPGVAAVRRGSINLEPTVRGLYEAQMGVFVDGTRTFAAGPARMDSELSHVSPHMLQSVDVVKGPYALTLGSGTLSSLQAQTFRPPFSGEELRVHGRASFNYAQNGSAPDGFAGIWGATNRLRFTVLHNTRIGHDYTDGDGVTIPGDYQSYDNRWDFGIRPTPALRLEYEGGYQAQEDLDYPGRILDASYLRTNSQAGEISWRPGGAFVTEVFGQAYANLKTHRMNNDEKPTAQPMEGRMPPFGIRVDLPTESNTIGGRLHVAWRQNAWEGKFGGDFYRLNQNAMRSIYNRDTGALVFEDIVWPDAKLTTGGGYGQVVYQRGGARVGGTLRVDTFHASAGEVSEFFLENTEGPLDYSQAAVSAALNTSFVVNPRWILTVGAGRAVRAPDTLERYSDRFPAAQFQVASEFLGNPQLQAEKSLEFNAGSILQLPATTIRADAFYRHIDNYITVTPDPSVPPRLPLSPPVVYRYINGDGAKFTGFEISVTTAVGAYLGLHGDWNYLWAEDETFDEPVFGIAPFRHSYGLELHTADGARWVDASATVTGAQNRVAAARFEQPTPGWTRLDLQGGMPLPGGLALRAGIDNVTNREYAEHLNALNPFSGERIPERGRSVYFGVEFSF